LRIGHVERLPSDLELVMLAPRHRERFRQTRVEIHITWKPQDIAVSSLSGSSIPEAMVGRRWIAEELRSNNVSTRRTRVDRIHPGATALSVPVCSPLRRVVRRKDRKTGVVPEDRRELPASQETVYPLICVSQKPLPASDGELPYSVYVYAVNS
jgi:hypothetical protein